MQAVSGQKVCRYANKGREKFFGEHNRYPTEEELVEILEKEYNVTIPNKEDLMQYTIQSIDSPLTTSVEDDVDYELVGEFANKTASNNVEEYIEKDSKSSLIKFLLSHLPERDREVVKYFFGIEHKERTPETIDDMFGLTKERVRKIIKISIEKIQHIKINKFK